ALPHAPRTQFVEPDRAFDREQPAVEFAARHELMRPFQSPDTSGLDEILGGVAIAREDKPIAPQRFQMKRQVVLHRIVTAARHGRTNRAPAPAVLAATLDLAAREN